MTDLARLHEDETQRETTRDHQQRGDRRVCDTMLHGEKLDRERQDDPEADHSDPEECAEGSAEEESGSLDVRIGRRDEADEEERDEDQFGD